ncbi:uncharacterized protein A4U43_C04F11100 [Asparagus officinalis]|uniref:Protein kinase domain-containing protein n=1 Tax=Asparagus officinalis TaxID=4686 RepID=A0A5P1EZY8_ASPOF|nr:uncharacterized protein A4U43_C04F11100 [Asparagus officinalis]
MGGTDLTVVFLLIYSLSHSLRRVILANNRFQGNIPENLSLNPGISYLDLSNNLFKGNIPLKLGAWNNLSMLDLSNNSFDGYIPSELGSLDNLQKLRISSNMLTGPIPSALGNCTKLLSLDLSLNSLSGKIPLEIVRLEKLQNLVLSGNKLTGKIPDSFTSTQSLLELQLGDNILEGQIPVTLGNLQYIYLALNLSNNKLTGEIPATFSNLCKLQVLDLSRNSLSGQIPLALSSMISLSFVNVSFNQLSGNLPANWIKLVAQLPNSFQGNPNLIINNEIEKKHRSKSTWRIPLVTIACILSLIGGALLASRYLAARKAHKLSAVSRISKRGFDSTGGLPEDLTYEDILRVTEDLSDKYVIGRGRNGTVYKTEFGKGKCWALKKFNLYESSFFLEMKIMSFVRHRNLVRMAGYCCRDGFRMIIYEYMAGGTWWNTV